MALRDPRRLASQPEHAEERRGSHTSNDLSLCDLPGALSSPARPCDCLAGLPFRAVLSTWLPTRAAARVCQRLPAQPSGRLRASDVSATPSEMRSTERVRAAWLGTLRSGSPLNPRLFVAFKRVSPVEEGVLIGSAYPDLGPLTPCTTNPQAPLTPATSRVRRRHRCSASTACPVRSCAFRATT
jgi:hypothetical protein